MRSSKLKLKINHSYESEPSSNSGSSLVEDTYNGDANFKLENIPPIHAKYTDCNIIKYDYQLYNEQCHDSFNSSILESTFDSTKESDIENAEDLRHSCSNAHKSINNLEQCVLTSNKKWTADIQFSKESSFENFIDSKINTVPKICLCNNIYEYEIALIDSDEIKKTQLHDIVPNENSCNAVDISPVGRTEIITANLENNILLKENKSEICANSTEKDLSYISLGTPPLFDDDDIDTEEITEDKSTKSFLTSTFSSLNRSDSVLDKFQRDKEMFRRIQQSLTGVPPPPSIINTEYDLFHIIPLYKNKIFELIASVIEYKKSNQVKKLDNQGFNDNSYLNIPINSMEEVKTMCWPNIRCARYHGLCYNLSKWSEKIEQNSLAVIERYIGSETRSSFSVPVSPSSAKKRALRQRMLQKSPGNRLSHLARRRAIFSSANLQTKHATLPASGLLTNKVFDRQILLNSNKLRNSRKSKVATPKRRSPTNLNEIDHPSSKRKLNFGSEAAKTCATRETSKRALFQSPPTEKQSTKISYIKPEIAIRVENTKRVLFSPQRTQNSSTPIITRKLDENNKRKRCDDDEFGNSQKLFRTSDDLTPRSLKIKSQSFCVGASNNETLGSKSLFRTRSDATFSSSQLSENHKKKLLWAVSQALQQKQIGVMHPNFKNYASVLTRIVKRIYLESGQKSGSTSEKMLRLAKKYVFQVIQGQTADEIYEQESSRVEYEKILSVKLSGYVGPVEYENRKNLLRTASSSTIISDFATDSSLFSVKQQTGSCDTLSQLSQLSETINDNHLDNNEQLPIQVTKCLQNSSSKNNLHGIALRENFDNEQRKSAQKNFTGKDQKNISPFNDLNNRSTFKKYSSAIFDLNAKKAKRQIRFDFDMQ